MTSKQIPSTTAPSASDSSPMQADTPQSAPLQPQTGLLDLEKELTCSICTDILYQPLTLLDCLHTFCGSCLKEWFAWQAAAAKQKRRQEGRSPSSQNLYTCPSCRASVRGTRPNATVTTLLDMYLQANPTRAKTPDEKNEISKHFKPGESVMPPQASPSPARPDATRRQQQQQADEDDDDRRLMEEVRQMSLRELERRGTRASRGEGDRRRHERNRRRDEMIGMSSAANERAMAQNPRRGQPEPSPSPGEMQQTNSRSLEHQSSLRSLISSSELDSQEMEEEIMRQILEEGLLDGIDLSNIDRNDEDEISERIAQAYRRRQRERERERNSGPRRAAPQVSRDDTGRNISSGPPSSYHLGNPSATGSTTDVRRSHRSSSQGSSRSARINHPARSSSDDISSHGTRDAVDLSSRSDMSDTSRRQHRRTTSREQGSIAIENEPSTERRIPSSRTATSLAPAVSPQQTFPSQQIAPNTNISSNASLDISSALPSTQPQDLSTSQLGVTETTTLAPFRYCSSCSKTRIQYDLHYTCSKCPPTTGSDVFALCLRCYRMGKGCPSWYGFGNTAWPRFRKQAPPGTEHAYPHFMMAERYVSSPSSEGNDDATACRQIGVFCDICAENSNTCFWRCDACNDGEWGFCNKCVNQARHCTHALLPVAWNAEANTSQSLPQPYGTLTALPVHTSCNVCGNPIPPSNTRFHCPSCNGGDYDICSSCYHSSVSSGKISAENGSQGWRKCENGHRMLVVGFESRPEGQRRIVLANVVGGWQMREEDAKDPSESQEATGTAGETQDDHNSHSHWSWRDTSSGGWKHKTRATSRSIDLQRDFRVTSATGLVSTQRLPPSGGFGFNMTALWTRIPDEGIEDELMFPKWAEISEALDINEDWCWGVYCKQGGLFPESFGRVMR